MIAVVIAAIVAGCIIAAIYIVWRNTHGRSLKYRPLGEKLWTTHGLPVHVGQDDGSLFIAVQIPSESADAYDGISVHVIDLHVSKHGHIVDSVLGSKLPTVITLLIASYLGPDVAVDAEETLAISQFLPNILRIGRDWIVYECGTGFPTVMDSTGKISDYDTRNQSSTSYVAWPRLDGETCPSGSVMGHPQLAWYLRRDDDDDGATNGHGAWHLLVTHHPRSRAPMVTAR